MQFLFICYNDRPGSRYYVDGKRVSREAYQLAQINKYLNSFHTVISGHVIRHYCCG